MINNYFYIFIIPAILLINFILKKNKFLLNYTGQKHQTYTIKNQIPLSLKSIPITVPGSRFIK